MKISDVMRRGAFTIGSNDCLGVAYEAMLQAHVRHLPVTSGDRLVGIVSERDLLAARARANGGDWWTIPVSRAMHAPAHTARPDDSLTEVAARMAATKIGAMPIVELGKLVGIATVTDVLDAEVRAAMAPAIKPTATAADVMTPYPITVRSDAPLREAAALLRRRNVRHLPVVDATSTIVGMLSERDVRTAIGDPLEHVEQRANPLVRDAMTRPAIVVSFSTPIAELAKRFADGRIGALPVIDQFGALIGIVSYVDALRVLAG
jgi:CBS domain-containing protein